MTKTEHGGPPMTILDRVRSAWSSVRPEGRKRPLPIRLLILAARVALAAIMLQAGISKLVSLPVTISMFAELGGPPMRYTLGSLETIGAIGVLIPILSGVAAIAITVLFVIIISVQVSVWGPSVIGLAVVGFVLAVAIAILQWHQTVRLVHLLQRLIRPTRTRG